MNSNIEIFEHPPNPNPLTQEQFLNLFITVYSLPKFTEQIRNTIFDSSQRAQRIVELRNRLILIIQKFNTTRPQFFEELTPSKYLKRQAFLKKKLIDHVKYMFPGMASFVAINYINSKLQGKYEKQCEQFLADIIENNRQQQMKKYVEKVLQKKFKSYDINNSGDINLQELQKRMEKLNLPKLIAKQIMQKADVTKNGSISLQQFKKYTENQVLKYYKIFYNLDSDNDHKLNYKQTKQSLHEIFPAIQIDTVFDQIFKTMDQDGSGFINFEEWCEFLIVFPQTNFNMMINQWGMFASTLINPQQSSSFLNKDLLQGTKLKNGKRIFSYWDIVRTLIFGGIAGGVSRTVTAPLERLKILYQTMYTQTKCPNILLTLKETYVQHGFLALYKGNSISIFLNCLEQALRFTIIQYSKKAIELKGDKIHPHQFLYIGVITGILSSIVLFPFEVLRIRFITSDDSKIFHKAKNIYQTSGPAGFYSGLTPHLMSVLPAGSFNVMSYSMLRRFFVSEKDSEHPNIYKFMLLGGCAALITNTVIYPLSLITSRIIVANKNVVLFKDKIGMLQMIKTIWNGEGFFGFYKGYQASSLRVFIGQAFNFGTYETLKSLWSMQSNYFNPKMDKKY